MCTLTFIHTDIKRKKKKKINNKTNWISKPRILYACDKIIWKLFSLLLFRTFFLSLLLLLFVIPSLKAKVAINLNVNKCAFLRSSKVVCSSCGCTIVVIVVVTMFTKFIYFYGHKMPVCVCVCIRSCRLSLDFIAFTERFALAFFRTFLALKGRIAWTISVAVVKLIFRNEAVNGFLCFSYTHAVGVCML